MNLRLFHQKLKILTDKKFREVESINLDPFAGSSQWDPETKQMVEPKPKPEPEPEPEETTLGGRLKERADKTYEYMKRQFEQANSTQSILDEIAGVSREPSISDYLKELPTDVGLSLGVGLGQVIGGMEDIVGTGIGKAYKAVMPEEAQEYIYDKFLDFSTTKAGQMGLAALGKGMAAYEEWAESNPDAAMELGSMLNLMGGAWGLL